jgi:hypothetical protein
MAELFFATLKTEFYYRRVWPTKKRARLEVGKWIEDRHNRRRRHASLGQISPVDLELQYSRQIADSQKPHNPCPRNGGRANLYECVDGVAPKGHLVAVIVDFPSSALWAVPLACCYREVDGRQETAGLACYESTAKRAKPLLWAALMTQQAAQSISTAAVIPLPHGSGHPSSRSGHADEPSALEWTAIAVGLDLVIGLCGLAWVSWGVWLLRCWSCRHGRRCLGPDTPARSLVGRR